MMRIITITIITYYFPGIDERINEFGLSYPNLSRKKKSTNPSNHEAGDEVEKKKFIRLNTARLGREAVDKKKIVDRIKI